MPSQKQTDDPNAGANVTKAPPPSALLLVNEAGKNPMSVHGPEIAPPDQSSGYGSNE